jgi:hypothetical protein
LIPMNQRFLIPMNQRFLKRVGPKAPTPISRNEWGIELSVNAPNTDIEKWVGY